MAKENSGIDALLEALRQSGVRFDKDANPYDSAYETEATDASSERGTRKDGSGGRGSGGSGDTPSINLNFGFADKMAAWGKRALIIGAIVLLLVVAFCYWWFHPPINIHSTDTWYFVAIFILLPLFLVFATRASAYKKGTAKVEPSESKAKAFKGLSYIPVALVLVGVIGAIASLSFFPGNAEKYAAVLETDSLDFAQDIKEVNYSEVPVIDRDSAVLLGNRTMGSIPEYVSQFEISPLYSQINYKQNPVRVSPLIYADLFKWFANKDAGIPAYVLVNMTTQDTQIVKLDTPIYYSQSEPLERNIDRHVQLKYPFYMFDQKSFEIDDEGHPWWICPVKDYTIGLFGGQTISRVVMCDANTGECQDIPVEECPQWVDRVYPAELLIQQYNWSGAYMSGWLNSWLGQQGVVQTTPGTSGQLGYNYIAKDDDVWVYSGVTSATADNSIVGFVLVNQRTAESHFYEIAGATEDSAMNSAEGQVQQMRYHATFPLLLNINAQPTYFMALKDDAGLVKMYAMLDIKRYQNVAVGNTVAECQSAYKQLLATNGVIDESEGSDLATKDASGVIETMAQAVIEGNSHFYVMLEGDDRIYDFAMPGQLGVVAYKIGDTISFSYVEAEGMGVVSAITSAVPKGASAAAAAAASSNGSDSEAAAGGDTASGAASGTDVGGAGNDVAGGATSA